MQSKDEENKPFPWNDCILKLCFLLQFMAFVLCGIAFFSPFWYIDLNREIRAGLWGRCDRDYECIWFFERGYERFLPGGFTLPLLLPMKVLDASVDWIEVIQLTIMGKKAKLIYIPFWIHSLFAPGPIRCPERIGQ